MATKVTKFPGLDMNIKINNAINMVGLLLICSSLSSLIPEPHFLIVDTNVVLHQLDVLEDEKLVNVVILQVR